MTGFFYTVSLFWLLPTLCHTWDIPLESALLIKGEPVGFTTRSAHRHKRSERSNETVTCKDDEYRPKNANYCCNKCLAGYRVIENCLGKGMKTECAPCQPGRYRKSPNPSKSCSPCNSCLSDFGQIPTQSCTTKNDTVCGCPAGQYKSDDDRKFTCLPCTVCKNGTERYQCTADRNTVCHCHLHFYLDSTGECRSCDECNHEDCAPHCQLLVTKPEESNMTSVIFAGGLGVVCLALVAVLVFKNRKKFSSAFQKKSSLTITEESGVGQLRDPLMEPMNKSNYLPGHTISVEEDAPQQQNEALNSTLPLPDITLQTTTPCLYSPENLYKIIEFIPYGRWREFVRRLGVSNHVIDTSEQDYRHCKDAQYAMLSFWVQNVGSSRESKDSMFKVLREMNLGGCIERIEESW
ncbi:tumor necrosis factor receptor superfamily member 1A [Anomaloglossus baeobatrachus]|uniref:tumor necrosis factor receptor superfamily member 1A n=1 Tax=Anomaloglossus baeobatrachus TaxID=238106 RepID=UPI003F50731E